MDRAIGDNIIAGSLDRYRTRWGTLDNSKTRTTIRELFDRLRVQAPRVAAPVRSLSGGSAHRVVLAKWLAIRPRVLILNGPTVGVDVGSKEDILEDSARRGRPTAAPIIIISDDVPELVAARHRAPVVRRGRISHTHGERRHQRRPHPGDDGGVNNQAAAALFAPEPSRAQQRGHPRADPARARHRRHVAAQPGRSSRFRRCSRSCAARLLCR